MVHDRVDKIHNTRKVKERKLTGRQRGTDGMMPTPVVCNLSVTKYNQFGEIRWMLTKVPCGVKVVDMHAVVDGVCTDEVVTELVDVNYRPRKS